MVQHDRHLPHRSSDPLTPTAAAILPGPAALTSATRARQLPLMRANAIGSSTTRSPSAWPKTGRTRRWSSSPTGPPTCLPRPSPVRPKRGHRAVRLFLRELRAVAGKADKFLVYLYN